MRCYMCIVQSKFYLAMFAPRPAPLLRPPCLGDADRVRLRESVNSREVRHSLTWHSSKSESALERFEPVAVVQQLPDGRGSVFAPVAARRQKKIKRGIPSSFCPFRSFRTSEKNSIRKVSLGILRETIGLPRNPPNKKTDGSPSVFFRKLNYSMIKSLRAAKILSQSSE